MPDFDKVFSYARQGGKPKNYFIARQARNGTAQYFGYVNQTQDWIIVKQDSATGEHKYYAGKGNFTTAWADYASHTYVEYYEL